MPPTSRRPAPASWRERLVVLATGIGLVTVMTSPTVPRLTSVGRLNTDDGRFSIWNVGWIDHALLTDPRHLFDANIFWPHTGTLAYSELNLVAGALGMPAFVLTGSAIAALNCAVALGLLLSFVCTWALVRRLAGSGGGGMVAAAGFTFCPYVQGHTPHIQLLMIFGFPLVLLAFHRLVDDRRVSSALTLGGALAVAALACAYYGLFAGVTLGATALCFGQRRLRYWMGLGIAAATAAVIVLPVFVPYLTARGAVGATRAVSLEELGTYSANLQAYLSSGSVIEGRLLGYLHPWPLPASELLFPGIVVLVLAAVGAVDGLRGADRTDRRVVWTYLGLAAFACWASFGPNAGLYGLLMNVPWMTMLRAPSRFGAVVVLALAVLAGFGVRCLSARRPWLPGALVAAVALDLFVPWPLQAAPPVPQAYEILARSPRGPVVEYPFPYVSSDFHRHSWPMFWSTYHWQPLVNGYSDVIPPDFYEIARPINFFPDGPSFTIMRDHQVRYLVWHMEAYDETSRRTLVARFPPYERYLRPLVTDGDTWLYEIVGWPEPPGAGK